MRTRSWLIALLVAFSMTSAPRALGQGADTQILDFFKSYDAAFNAKDLAKLATLYHPEVTIFEGAGINRGWADYRDNHLGPELKSFQNLQWAHSNIVVHVLSEASSYVTAEYTIKYQAGERVVRVDGHGGDGEHGRRPYACRTRC